MGETAEIIASGLRFPEGPVWCADGTVVCTAVAAGTVHRVWPGEGRTELVATTGGGPNAAAPIDDGGFLVTQNGGIDYSATGLYADPPPYEPVSPGIQRVLPDGGTADVLRSGFLAPNDLVVTSEGTLLFTDPPAYPPPPEAIGRVHALAPNGELRTIADGFTYCNGIALEPDGTIVVVEGQGLMRVDSGGTKEWITRQVGGHGGDGFCVDVDGNFYVAATIDHGIRVIDSHGTELDFLPIPDPGGLGVTTNCCFGGPDGRTLFATDGVPGQLVAWEHMPVPGRAVYAWAAQ